MVATTNAPLAQTNRLTGHVFPIVKAIIVAGFIWALSRQGGGLLIVAMLCVAALELWPIRRHLTAEAIWRQVPPLAMGLSTALIIALLLPLPTQVAVAVLYAGWRLWHVYPSAWRDADLAKLLVVQGAVFEALFLMAAEWHVARPIMLILVWLGVYATTYQMLAARGERAAGILAAAWALIATEASWVFLVWLVSYVAPGAYVIVPQPALVLTALAYCFGNIYAAQRQGLLNRTRLTEYLLIGLILIWIVIAGTPWRGTL